MLCVVVGRLHVCTLPIYRVAQLICTFLKIEFIQKKRLSVETNFLNHKNVHKIENMKKVNNTNC